MEKTNITILGKSESCIFTAEGLMQRDLVHLAKGTKIYAHGFGMSLQNFVVIDDNMNAVEIGDPSEINSIEDLPDRYFSARRKLDDDIRPISKKFGIGFYYDESGELISDDIIEKSLQRAEKIDQLTKVKKALDKRNAEELEKQLIKDYSFLKRCSRYDHKICGDNIRTELKRVFPGVKFSVRYESFSGGDAFNISWTDGPTTKQIGEITDKYGDMHPDSYSMGDYWDCVPTIFNRLFGSVGYITNSRKYSDEAINKVISLHPGFDRGDACDVLHKTDLTPVVEAKPEKSNKKAIKDGFSIVDYSAKAFAIVGDTKQIKDDLKKLGGRFNARLTCGAGWIFSNTKRSQVETFLATVL